MIRGLALALLLLTPITLGAQAVEDTVPTNRLQWDQPAGSVTEANALRILAYVNGATTGSVEAFGCQTGPTSGVFVCTTTRNAGQIAGSTTLNVAHTVILASQTPLGEGNFTPESRSAVCSFRFRGSPAAPQNLRFVP